MPQAFVTPPEGVRAFINRFGGIREAVNAAKAVGLSITFGQVKAFITNDKMPDFVLQSLSHLVVSEEIAVNSGHLEFYANGVAVGKFYLPRGVSCVVRKARR